MLSMNKSSMQQMLILLNKVFEAKRTCAQSTNWQLFRILLSFFCATLHPDYCSSQAAVALKLFIELEKRTVRLL